MTAPVSATFAAKAPTRIDVRAAVLPAASVSSRFVTVALAAAPFAASASAFAAFVSPPHDRLHNVIGRNWGSLNKIGEAWNALLDSRKESVS